MDPRAICFLAAAARRGRVMESCQFNCHRREPRAFERDDYDFCEIHLAIFILFIVVYIRRVVILDAMQCVFRPRALSPHLFYPVWHVSSVRVLFHADNMYISREQRRKKNLKAFEFIPGSRQVHLNENANTRLTEELPNNTASEICKRNSGRNFDKNFLHLTQQ